MLDALTDFGESDPLIFITCGLVALAALVVLIVVIVWPLDGRVRIERDQSLDVMERGS